MPTIFMKIHTPNNLPDLLKIKSNIRFHGWSPYLAFFRGQIYDWSIKNGLARQENYSSQEILEKERLLFDEFQNNTDPDLKLQKHLSSEKYEFAQTWINLFQAQHLGIHTRLTDWTQDFFHALMFAVDDENNEKIDEPGVLYIFKCPRQLLINFNTDENLEKLNQNPFELDKFYLIKHYSQFIDDYFGSIGEVRRFRQDGSFIISPSNRIMTSIETVEYLKKHLEKVQITPSLKKEIKNYIRTDLDKYLYDKQSIEKNDQGIRIREKTKAMNKNYF